MTSRDRLLDCLKDERYLTALYNSCAHGFGQPALRQLALEHLQDCHRHAERIIQLLAGRDWKTGADGTDGTLDRAARSLGLKT